jgi:hypothetical protein
MPVPGRTALAGHRVRVRAAQWEVHAEEHCSREARAREQSFIGVGENAYYRAEIWGALAHQDVCLPEGWALSCETIPLNRLH